MGYAVAEREQTATLPLDGKVLVVGLGKTGLSCARFLSKKGLQVAVTDSRDNPPGLEAVREEMPELPLFLGGFNPSAFESADCLVVSPGLSLNEGVIGDAWKRGVPVVGDIELFARYADAPVVAITGSNGKTTVTTLLGEMAKEAGIKVAVGGNIGEPALDLLDKGAELYVLELSSFQLDTTETLSPGVSTVLNVSADHMDRYPSFDAYAASKAGIYRYADKRVFNGDDPQVMKMADVRPGDVIFALREPGDNEYGIRQESGKTWLCRGDEKLLTADELLIPGWHNIANALAATALADLMGISAEAQLKVLRRFRGLPHRSQLVAEHNGIRWYNDSKGTNVGATAAALDGLVAGDGRVILIAGGDCKGAEFADLVAVAERTTRTLILIGRDAEMIEEVMQGHVEVDHAADMDQAVEKAAVHARPGDCVLLSPACASFDMFDNYMHRGDVFCRAVENYLESHSDGGGRGEVS